MAQDVPDMLLTDNTAIVSGTIVNPTWGSIMDHG